MNDAGPGKDKNVFHLPSISFRKSSWPFSGDYETVQKSFKRLSSRALLMARRDDIVVLDKLPEPEYLALLKECHAGGIPILTDGPEGFSLAEEVAGSPKLIKIIEEWDGRFEIYMPGLWEERIGEATGRSVVSCGWRVAELLNDKIFFYRLMEDLDLPRIPGFIGNSDAVAGRIRKIETKPSIVRSSASVGGSLVWPLRNDDERTACLEHLDKMGRDSLLVMQPLRDVLLSPNLQFYIADDQVYLFCETVQILHDKMDHRGNFFDRVEDPTIREKLLDQGKELAFQVAAMGYRGVLGVDFIITEDEEVFAVEMNARHNTSTYAAWFTNRFTNGDPLVMIRSGSALCMSLPAGTPLTPMQWIERLGEDAFNPDRASGVLPFGGAPSDFTFLVIGHDEHDRRRLVARAESLVYNPHTNSA